MARASSMVWDGMKELRESLALLPEACTDEAAKAVEGEVNAAYVTVSTVYGQHRFTGTLQDRLKIEPLKIKGALTTGLVLKSGSPLAWLFDNGSQARHHASGKSTGAMWGKTPPTHIFARTIGQARRNLAVAYREMLLRRGASSVTEE